MNKRIQELAEQAGITFEPIMIDGIEYEYQYVRCNDTIGGDEAGCIKKFAEILVKECTSICEANGQTYKYSFTPAKARLAESTSKCCSALIKDHFGVEE
jgi:hypothetical protein